MKKTIILFLLIILTLSFSAFAVQEYYNETGGENNYYNGGNMLFNADYLQVYGIPSTYSALITSTTNNATPLVTDLDGDGIKEIIAISGNNLQVYHGKTLTANDSYTLGTGNMYSSLYTFDINGDGSKEIFVADYIARNFTLLKYNTTLQLFGKYDLKDKGASTTTDELQVMFKCSGVDKCFIAYTDRREGTAGSSSLYGATFNRTEFLGYKLIANRALTPFCFPRIPAIEYKDYDGDGTNEMIFSYYDTGASTSAEVVIVYMELNASGEYVFDRTKTTNGDGQGANCNTASGFLTSPLVFDAIVGAKLETIIAHAWNSIDEFKIEVFDYTGTQINVHPYLTEADGVIVSNLIRMSAFPSGEGENNDYCVMGYSQTDQVLDLLCGSSDNVFNGLDTIEFFNNYNYYNVTTGFSFLPITFKVNAEANNFDGHNTDEIFNTYGTFELTDDNCPLSLCGTCSYLSNYCKLNNLFENGAFGTTIPIDYEGVGYSDYLAVTDYAIFYIEDKYTNSAPTFGSNCCSVNPSNPIQINSTIGVTLSADDVDVNDLVSYRVIFYYQDNNEYTTDWTTNISDNQVLVLTGIANKTISTSKIRLQVRDNFDVINHITNLDYDMSVANQGFVFGESSTTIGGTTTTESNLSSTIPQTISPENAISKNVNSFANNFGFSGTLMYLLIGLFIIFGVWIAGMITKIPSNISSVFLISTLVLWFIIGIYLEYIGIGVVIILVLIALAFILPFIKHIFTGTSSK